VILVNLGQLVHWDPGVPQARVDFQAVLVRLDSLESQDLRAHPDQLEILEAQDSQVQRALLALLEVVAVRDSKVSQEVLDSLEQLEIRVHLDELDNRASQVCQEHKGPVVMLVQLELQVLSEVQVIKYTEPCSDSLLVAQHHTLVIVRLPDVSREGLKFYP